MKKKPIQSKATQSPLSDLLSELSSIANKNSTDESIHEESHTREWSKRHVSDENRTGSSCQTDAERELKQELRCTDHRAAMAGEVMSLKTELREDFHSLKLFLVLGGLTILGVVFGVMISLYIYDRGNLTDQFQNKITDRFEVINQSVKNVETKVSKIAVKEDQLEVEVNKLTASLKQNTSKAQGTTYGPPAP